MRNRKFIEENEKKILESYSVLSGTSQGRHFAEEEHEYRTAFQRDRDRIVHSSAFR